MFTSISSRVQPHARHTHSGHCNEFHDFLFNQSWYKMAPKRWEMKIALTRMCQHDFVVAFNLMCVGELKQQREKKNRVRANGINFICHLNQRPMTAGCCMLCLLQFINVFTVAREQFRTWYTYLERWLLDNDCMGIAKRFGWNCMSWLWYQMIKWWMPEHGHQCNATDK